MTRGFVLIELMGALVVFVIIMCVAFTGDAAQLRHVAEAFAETKAGRIASGRLEHLRGAGSPPKIGQTEFVVEDLPDALGQQSVRRVDTGLIELSVVVAWMPRGAARRRRVVLTTLFEEEFGR